MSNLNSRDSKSAGDGRRQGRCAIQYISQQPLHSLSNERRDYWPHGKWVKINALLDDHFMQLIVQGHDGRRQRRCTPFSRSIGSVIQHRRSF